MPVCVLHFHVTRNTVVQVRLNARGLLFHATLTCRLQSALALFVFCLQVLIAGAVIAGGYIVYSLIQSDPEAKRAINDAKGR